MEIRCAHSEIVDITTLVPNPRNPNRHGEAQIKLLAKIMAYQGWRSPIIVSKRSGFIVKGHGRLDAAILNGWEKAPIDRQDYATEADEWADMIADNKIAELAESDDQLIQDIALDLGPDFDFDLLGIPDFKVIGIDTLPPMPGQGSMSDKFMIPPFSVLNAREGWWQDRKRYWISMGILSGLGRGGIDVEL